MYSVISNLGLGCIGKVCVHSLITQRHVLSRWPWNMQSFFHLLNVLSWEQGHMWFLFLQSYWWFFRWWRIHQVSLTVLHVQFPMHTPWLSTTGSCLSLIHLHVTLCDPCPQHTGYIKKRLLFQPLSCLMIKANHSKPFDPQEQYTVVKNKILLRFPSPSMEKKGDRQPLTWP